MLEIKSIEEHQIEEAKQVITKVCLEIWQGKLIEEELKHYDPMFDLDNVRLGAAHATHRLLE